ncbi:MAG: hypothetical protein WDM94_14680 [Bauldia sp.]
MTKVQEIEKAISALAPTELAEFRAWYEAFDAERFDARIARDAADGKLDQLAEAALADFKTGRTRDL